MDYIQTSNYWGNSYWGGGYWGAIGTRRSEVFRVSLVISLSVLALGALAQTVPAAQLINFSVDDLVVLNVKEEVNSVLNKIVTDTYDELEEL